MLLPEHPRENQRRADRGVTLDDVLRGRAGQLAPSDFFVGHRAGVAAVARRRVADLAEIAPQRHARAAEILVQHGYDADREIAGDTAANLEETDRALAV